VKDIAQDSLYPQGSQWSQFFWYCIQTQPKHEHIACACLKKGGGIEVFNPQLKIHRATTRGPVWFTESAFPGYIFARLNLQTQLDLVSHTAGVTRVVQFNSVYPSVPDQQVEELRALFGDNSQLVMPSQVMTGDTVRILSGAFRDFLAVVQSVHPAKQRVRALLEFLGRMTSLEVDTHNLKVERTGQAPQHPLCRI
jgi:transcription antitermination factor NusG